MTDTAQLLDRILSNPELSSDDKVHMSRQLLNSAARLGSAPSPTHSHQIDKRADALLADEGDDDDLLDTRQMAAWFGVSTQWLEIGRLRRYGPPYICISPKRTRYRRGDAREWLRGRTHQSTSEYATTGGRKPGKREATS